MSDYIIEYRGISTASSGAIVGASVNPSGTSPVKMILNWKGAKMLLASYDANGWFNFSPGSPLHCPADAEITVEGAGTGAIAWRSV